MTTSKQITQPQVFLLDYTGKGHFDPLYAAKKLIYTKRTRLEQGQSTWDATFAMPDDEVQKELIYIRDSIRSCWEFVTFTFQILDVSRGFTHQFVRTRTASYAQQSQRVVDMSGFDYVVPAGIQNNPEAQEVYSQIMEAINNGYKELIDLKAPMQDARGVLPTNVGTSIVVELNLRTLADLAGKRDNPRAMGEYTDVFRGMAEAALEVMPWIDGFLYPPRLKTPALDKILRQLRGDHCAAEFPELNDAMKELDRLKGVWG